MSGEAPLSVSRFAVGSRTCVMTIARPQAGQVAACVMEWLPDAPKRLGPVELQEYRRGRDAALSALAERLGITAMVLEM